MNEVLKNRSVIILAILSVVFFLGMLVASHNAARQKAARDSEMVARLALEERTNKYAQEKSALEEKAKAKENEAAELKVALQTAQKTLIHEQLVSQNLKEELQKATKLKEPLEEDTRQAPLEAKKFKK